MYGLVQHWDRRMNRLSIYLTIDGQTQPGCCICYIQDGVIHRPPIGNRFKKDNGGLFRTNNNNQVVIS